MHEIPLGKPTDYADKYCPELLFAVPRAEARGRLGLTGKLPFNGIDIWNAWELTWLDAGGKPKVATASIFVNAESANIIESKSLKLYLNSFAMTRFESEENVSATMKKDLSRIAESPVDVAINSATDAPEHAVVQFPGSCIDNQELQDPAANTDAKILQCDDDSIVAETLYTHLLRSNCPVTGQPDMGSIMIRYQGAQIARASLLKYIVSYRQHQDFHEACVERIFLDIQKECRPTRLTVYARYNRRGGLDINPFRTNSDEEAENSRLWRQ